MIENAASEINCITDDEALLYLKFTTKKYRQILMCCQRPNVIAVGVKAGGEPCGLLLAVYEPRNKLKEPETWWLLSFFIARKKRRCGLGGAAWDKAVEEIRKNGGTGLGFQCVLAQEEYEELSSFLKKRCQQTIIHTMATIFRLNAEEVGKSNFGKSCENGAFQIESQFCVLSFDEMSRAQKELLKNGEAQWYPENLSPFIMEAQRDDACTIFASDGQGGEIVGWINVPAVNGGRDMLYRSFFTKPEYRKTKLGFYLLTISIRRHLERYRDRGVLFAVAEDNPRMERYVRRLFREVQMKISYECESYLPL